MQVSKHQIVHLKVESSSALNDFLLQKLEISNLRCDELLQLGCIYKNEKRLRPDVKNEAKNITILPGDVLRVHQNPRRFNKKLFQYPKCLILEHADFIIINKPSGLPVPPTVDNAQENLVQFLSECRKEQLHVTHRLDIATAGLMFFARSKTAQREFNELLVNRKVSKLYRATVSGQYQGAKLLTHYMEQSPKAPKHVSPNEHEGWLECRLKILSNKFDSVQNRTVLEIELLTGRTHQIRAQLAAEGHPVIGDRLYGDVHTLTPDHECILLESYLLSFPWYGEEMNFKL